MISPVEVEGGSQERCAPSTDFEILMADGAPGKPGRHVLNADTSDHGPRPQALIPATRNLYAVPGCKKIYNIINRFMIASSGSLSISPGKKGVKREREGAKNCQNLCYVIFGWPHVINNV